VDPFITAFSEIVLKYQEGVGSIAGLLPVVYYLVLEYRELVAVKSRFRFSENVRRFHKTGFQTFSLNSYGSTGL